MKGHGRRESGAEHPNPPHRDKMKMIEAWRFFILK